MQFVDVFAWVVLVPAVTADAVFVTPGMLPGRVARRRGHSWAEVEPGIKQGQRNFPWLTQSPFGKGALVAFTGTDSPF